MTAQNKDRLRSELLAARRAVPENVRWAESEQLRGHLIEAVEGAASVCAYVAMGAEPGSPEILDALSQLCATVLLPVARTGPDGEHLPLHWGRYVPGRLTKGRFGAQEPAAPWLPASAVATADMVLVPALAVDRRGVRLGRGGGFYDRSLRLCRPGARLVAVVRDSEVLDEVPSEAHDVPLTHALTPGAGLMALGNARCANGGSST
jgi:5-formyltetrahydrofolate cyclo-ligase